VLVVGADKRSLSPRPVLTSLVIAALGFLPVFAFTGETGRLLRPLALTKTLVILALEVIPVLYTLWRGRQLRAAQRRGIAIASIVGRPPPWARCD